MAATLRVSKGVLPGLYVVGAATASRSDTVTSAPSSTAAATTATALTTTYVLSEPTPSAAAHSPASSPRDKFRGKPIESAFDERSVSFNGYFRESVPESDRETWRQRNLQLKFFLGDGTLDIFDPETVLTKNDGIIHGKFLRRTKVPGLDRSNFVDVLRIGSSIEVFGRIIYLYACDAATRSFFEDVGYPQPENEEPEVDEFTAAKAKTVKPPFAWYGTHTSTSTRFLEAGLGAQRDFKDTKSRYLKYDGVQLKFLLLWKYMDGVKQEAFQYWLTYYMATEESEINEVKGQRNYRSWPTLLKRSRLPKSILPHDDRMRSCEEDTGYEDYYHERDFCVGETIQVFGRDMLICDCDDFTQGFYMKEFGLDQRARKVDLTPAPVEEKKVSAEPIWGEAEAELRKKLHGGRAAHDKKRSDTVLTFKAFFSGEEVEAFDGRREFRVFYYDADQEVAIFEKTPGGKRGAFLRKMKLTNPATGKAFEAADFAVGSEVSLNAFKFYLFDVVTAPGDGSGVAFVVADHDSTPAKATAGGSKAVGGAGAF